MSAAKILTLTSSLVVSGLLLSGCSWLFGDETEPETPDTEEEIPADETDTEDTDTDSDVDDPEDEDEAEVEQDVTVWFPQLEDTLLDYEGQGNEFAPFTRYPQFVKDDTLQMVESTGGTEIVIIYEYADDEVREVFKRAETYFREDFDDTGLASEQENFEIILQQPLEEGHTWESPSGSVAEITGINIEKDLPIGNVMTIEVTRSYEDGSEVLEYYGENIGLVERVFQVDDDEENNISSTLGTLSENTPEEFQLTVYSVDDQAMGLDSTLVTMELYTNEPARLAIADILKGQAPDTETAQVIADGVDINFMYLRQDGVVHADFSVELADMNAGSGVEAMILQGIVNTIGEYYGVEDVLITLDNEPYESGHILMEEGETWSVDHSNVN